VNDFYDEDLKLKPNKYQVVRNIEIDRVNKMLYTNLTSIATKMNYPQGGNPLQEKSEEIAEHLLTRRRHKMQDIERANHHLLQKLQNVSSEYRSTGRDSSLKDRYSKNNSKLFKNNRSPDLSLLQSSRASKGNEE
jgi:hypothetical protein